MIEEEEIKK